MDLKKEAARAAYSLVENETTLGLGDGTAVRWLSAYIIDGIHAGLQLKLYTSSIKTQQLLLESGIPVNDISRADHLDQYFDGCDQLDLELNALKSGAGIHTQEKLLAVMAKNFILLADESKFISAFDPVFPLVLEVLPQAVGFVSKELVRILPGVSLSIRKSPENQSEMMITRNGNYLIDCRFQQWPDPEFIQNQTKPITGLVEISLFYKMADGAFIAGRNGVTRYQRIHDHVQITGRYPVEI
jgi:ribose 5-phosphate isomerase A